MNNPFAKYPFQIGDRVTFGAVYCSRITNYELESRDHEGTVILWRHAFRTPTGEYVVYTGVRLNVHTGRYYDIKGTVARLEEQYKTIRIKRAKVLQESDWKFL